jgi:threonine dehydratase
MFRIARAEGRAIAHATNSPRVITGAATIAMEMLAQSDRFDAVVVAVGGGSQSVGAVTVARELAPELSVYGAQAAGRARYAIPGFESPPGSIPRTMSSVR